MIFCMPGAVLAAGGTVVEAEQAVDLGLVEHARGLAGWRCRPRRRSPRPRRRPVPRPTAAVSLGVVAHWISIWVNSTSVTRAGAAAMLARRDQFLAQPVGAGGAAQFLGPHLAQIGLEHSCRRGIAALTLSTSSARATSSRA